LAPLKTILLKPPPTYKRIIRGANPYTKKEVTGAIIMKKINIIGVLLAVLMLPIASAHEPVDPGVTPDSFLWGLDKALDNLNLLLTFDPTEKARKGIEIARERLEEVKVMAEENKIDFAEKAKDEQVRILSKVKTSISNIKEENSTKQVEKEIEIEKELEEFDGDVNDVSDNLKIKIEVKGNLSEEQKALLDSLLSTLKDKTGEVKIEIKNKKDETKIKIKQETGKSEKDVEDEIENIEEEQGLADIKKEHATEEIDNAKENIGDLEKELQEQRAKGHVVNETPITTLMENAKEKISSAEEALKNKDLGEAFGQANAAGQLIKNAKRILEKTVEKFQENKEEHGNQEIKVEIKNGEAKVKIEIGDAKLRFTLNTTDKNAVIQEIATRTGLSVDEVAKLAKFEEHKDEAKETKERIEKSETGAEVEEKKVKEETGINSNETDKDKVEKEEHKNSKSQE